MVELLVVIAIIGVLASVVLANLRSATDKTKVASTKAELTQIQIAFEYFFDKYNDYPPVGGDHCDMCYQVPASLPYASGSWSEIIDLLSADGFITGGAKKDAWGNPYLYDKNYLWPCHTYSPICSMGPDQKLETSNCPVQPIAQGDDICAFIPDDQADVDRYR